MFRRQAGRKLLRKSAKNVAIPSKYKASLAEGKAQGTCDGIRKFITLFT